MNARRLGIGGGSRAALLAVGVALALLPALSEDAHALPDCDPPTINGDKRDGSTLTGTAGSCASVFPVTQEFEWFRCDNADGSVCVSVSGTVGDAPPDYTLGPADVGKYVRLEQRSTETPPLGTDIDSGVTGQIAALAPSNLSPPSIPADAPTVGQQLTRTGDGTWSGSSPAFTRTWLRCSGATVATCTTELGTGISYTPVAADAGSRLAYRVTATNSAGNDSAVSNLTDVVTDPPDNTALPAVSSSGPFRQGQTLTATTGGWSDPAPTGFAFQWQRCGSSGGGCTDIAGAAGSSYALTADDVGRRLRVVVTASARNGTAVATSAATPVIEALPSRGGGPGGGTRMLRPFPVVAVRGGLLPRGAAIAVLRVTGERGATVRVRCRGRGCPVRRFKRRIRRGGRARLRPLERFLRGGVVIVIRVTKPGAIGKYTRMRIRGGVRKPKRVDRCLRPGARRPSRCPS